MSKAKLITLVGTLASFAAGGGSLLFHEPYRALVAAAAGVILGWLHLPRPVDAGQGRAS